MFRAPIHPVLFGVAPVLSLFAANQGHIELAELGLPFALALCLLGAWWGTIYWLNRDLQRSAVIASAGAALFFLFDRAWVLLENRDLLGKRPVEEGLLVVVWALAFTGICRVTSKPFDFRGRLCPILNAVGLVLVVLPTLSSVDWQIRNWTPAADSIARQAPSALVHFKPDIDYIVLDAYGETNVLRAMFGFDNRQFLKRLEEKGFYIARRSLANYSQTHLSLASSLNFSYLDSLAERLGPRSFDRRPI